ncbi:hypothetical protein BHM03_00019877 [Ensete ventricosum]|nr:hypothetical protein BHM03_00019877 [Ensete ventricosum]
MDPRRNANYFKKLSSPSPMGSKNTPRIAKSITPHRRDWRTSDETSRCQDNLSDNDYISRKFILPKKESRIFQGAHEWIVHANRKRTKICRNQSLHAGCWSIDGETSRWIGQSQSDIEKIDPHSKNPKPITSTPRTPEPTATNRLKPTKHKKKKKAYRPARSDQGSRFTTLKTATKATQEEHPARARVSLAPPANAETTEPAIKMTPCGSTGPCLR